ncbi:Protein O-mannosyltransferase 2 [Coemansia sp. RSA 989]|nr:Protein O-mannosyltransferase 2 [Coemansia sp. RSA 989]
MSLFEHQHSGKVRRRHIETAAAKPVEPAESLFKDDADDAAKNKPSRFSSWNPQHTWNIVALMILSAITRFYQIGRSTRVVWDEAHFGKFGAHYVNGTFYHDVHPPLAKMLVGLSEILTGFDGSFAFSSGERYPENVNYVFMRVFNASFGVPLAAMAYCTLLNLGCRPNTALLGGLLVCMDNALCTISRFILLDAMLLCFTGMSALGLSGLFKHRKQPFTRVWWMWLAGTGIALGLVASAKWVGAFSVALVGIYTVYELYDELGLPEMRLHTYLLHWIARIIALIAIPVSIYMLCFHIHFTLLYKSGPGDSEMDSLFQANLQGTGLKEQPLDIAYGSIVTIKSAMPGVGLLHSHPDTYPDGSKQQQITGYTHKDENNRWVVEKVHGQKRSNSSETLEFVHNGDVVRLVHSNTQRNLHSHPVAAIQSKRDFEVSGYGIGSTYPDGNDHWRVEVFEELSRKNPQNRLRTLTTRFRLRHIRQNCLLRATGKSLPSWAWNQAEIVCDRRSSPDDKSLWNIESHANPLLPPADPDDLKSPFLRNFVRLNAAMARTNNALKPDPDKFDALTSSPLDWPLMRLGLRICGWEDTEVKFFLIGNPVVWWGSTLAVVLGMLQLAYYAVEWKRGRQGINAVLERHLGASWILLGGWALHFVPFFLFGRVTYLHHYFCSLYFAAMYLAYLVEWSLPRPALVQVVVGVAAGTCQPSLAEFLEYLLMESKNNSLGFPRLNDDEHCRHASRNFGVALVELPSRRSSSNTSAEADSPLTMHGAPLLFSSTAPLEGAARPVPATITGRVCGAVQYAFQRAVGEEDVPYVTLLVLRLTRAVPGAQYLVHPRVVCVLGGIAVVAPSIGFTALEKLIADDLEFHTPIFMHILVLALAAMLVELFTGHHGLFVRSPPVRTSRLLPLVALYTLSVALSHLARQFNSVHGTFQTTQALLPLVVVVGSTGVHQLTLAVHARICQPADYQTQGLLGTQSPLRARTASSSQNNSRVSISRLIVETDDDIEAGRSGYASGNSSASSFGGLLFSDEKPSLPPANGNLGSHGRGLAIAVGCLVALTLWSPAAIMVGDASQLMSSPNAAMLWMRSTLNIGISVAVVVCNAALILGISNQLNHQRAQSSTALVRHFAPLCMLATLVLWPLLEQPVDVLAALDARRLFSCLGVAALGALSWIARIAMLRATVSDGAVGVATILQIKPLVCLGIGWWAFGYANSWLQIGAYIAACAGMVAWIAVRLLSTDYPELVPVISPHMYRSARSRKYSSAI